PHAKADQDRDGQAEQQLTADVAAHHPIQALDEEGDVAPVTQRCVAGRPVEKASAIKHEIDTNYADDDGVENHAEQTRRHRHDVTSEAFKEGGQICCQAVDLILRDPKLLQVYGDGGRPVGARRLQPCAHSLDEGTDLLYHRGD